jgi:anti-sigma regulatory factor (Ser/Thr protein kinase)
MAAQGDLERRARWTLTAETAAVGSARHRVVSWLACSDLPRPVVEDALLVLSELVTNAVQASGGSPAKVRIHLSRTSAGCRITVADNGPGFSQRPITNGDALRDGGRGLAVVRRVAAEVAVRRRATGWTVVSALVPVEGLDSPARAR